jgi:RHS repeat-associated protein
VTDYLLGSQGIEAKIDETSQTEAYYEINPTTGARLFDANNNLIVAYRGVTSWYIYDGHGNVVGTVNGVTGAFTANPTLDVYGVPRATGAAATKQGYCGSLGHVTDDTGLVYMRARYYDANVGRFVSEDPGVNGNNWYVYAGDNPVNMTDSDGKSSVWMYGFFCISTLFFQGALAALTMGAFGLAIGLSIVGCLGCGCSVNFSQTSPWTNCAFGGIGAAGGLLALNKGIVSAADYAAAQLLAKSSEASADEAAGVGGGVAVIAIATFAVEGAMALGIMAVDG